MDTVILQYCRHYTGPSASPTNLPHCIAVHYDFITSDSFLPQHYILYEKVGWCSLANRREQQCMMFVYKALLPRFP